MLTSIAEHERTAVSPASLVRPVVLAGGAGTRLWPMSRQSWPKQLLAVGSEHAMVVETVRRVARPGFAAPVLVCNDEHRFAVAELLAAASIAPQAIILEPERRNTAPAVAIAALAALKEDTDAIILVMPADHAIADPEGFQAAVGRAVTLARAGYLVTFGIMPDRPHTGYGYIRLGEPLPSLPGAFVIERFLEKPDRETAERLIADASHLWNSGIFLFPARLFLEELGRYKPAVLEAAESAFAGLHQDLGFWRVDAAAFRRAPSISVDVGVMERTERGAVLPVEIGWNDLGTWQALWDVGEKDGDGNICVGEVLVQQAQNCYLRSEGGQLVAAVGVDNLVVVATDDAVLVSGMGDPQAIKRAVDQLAAAGRAEYACHLTVHRPWGSYRRTDQGDRFQVKQIIVKPGAKLSLQYHNHRAEHWVVVQGTARVTCGERTFLLYENESTYIPIGAVHRLENPGKIPLRLVEVQSGPYLGEDDIVRIEDDYRR